VPKAPSEGAGTQLKYPTVISKRNAAEIAAAVRDSHGGPFGLCGATEQVDMSPEHATCRTEQGDMSLAKEVFPVLDYLPY